MFTRSYLLELRRKAFRNGVWYRVLDDLDRGILNLVMIVVDKVESDVLCGVIVRILKSMRDSTKSEFVRFMESQGVRMARERMARAMEWGYPAVRARKWVRDVDFARYLTCIMMNVSPQWDN